MEGELYTQIKYLLGIGALHAAATVMLTEYLKNAWSLGGLGARLFPILWSVTVTLLAFPHSLTLVGLEPPVMHWAAYLCALLLLGITGAAVSFFLYNVYKMLRQDLLKALQNKVKKWGEK